MSFYATIQGEITFPTQERLDQAVNELTEDGWMKDGKFIDECGNIFDEQEQPDVQGLTLRIPFGLYRNLSRRIDDLTQGTTGKVVYTSTDGCFEGGVWLDGVFTCYDLKLWARENMEEENSLPPDINDDFSAYCEWMSEVEMAFHEQMA